MGYDADPGTLCISDYFRLGSCCISFILGWPLMCLRLTKIEKQLGDFQG